MKKKLVGVGLFLLLLAPTASIKAQDPITLIIKEGIKKVIQAVDLKIQRLQNRTIWLQNAQKIIENAMSKAKLTQISDWVEKQRVLYQDYFKELYEVKNILAYYHKVKGMTEMQLSLVKEYKRVYDQIKQDGHFTAEEILYMGQVYSGIIEASLKNLDDISVVVNSFKTQMSDAKRMELMDKAMASVQENYDDLRAFNAQNIRLSLVRAKDEQDIRVIKKLYGLQ